MAREVLVSKRDVQDGRQSFGPLAVPVGADYGAFYVDVTDMLSEAQSVTVSIRVSLSNGKDWAPPLVFTFGGGPPGAEAKAPPRLSKIGFEIPEPNNIERVVEATTDVIGGPFPSSLEFETKEYRVQRAR